MVEGLAPVERRLPPPEDLGRGVERLKYFRLKYKYIAPRHNSHRNRLYLYLKLSWKLTHFNSAPAALTSYLELLAERV